VAITLINAADAFIERVAITRSRPAGRSAGIRCPRCCVARVSDSSGEWSRTSICRPVA
jgi:hypothetical protein